MKDIFLTIHQAQQELAKGFSMTDNHLLTIVVATGDKSTQRLVEAALNDPGCRVIAVSSVKEFFEILLENDIDLIIYDPEITSLKGLDAFSIAKFHHPDIPSILVYQPEDYQVTKLLLDKGFLYQMRRPVNELQMKQVCDTVRKIKIERNGNSD